MRLLRLDLLAYGPFRDVSLDLAKDGLHVVYGGNEAGKSTTLRAISGLLYGIERKTRDDHVHKKADLRIGGILGGPSGERLRIVRRKGDTNTLLDEHGKPLDEAPLRRMLAGVTRETFESAFGLDHVKLREGAKALLEGKGALGESLFDASVGGGGDVQRLLRQLEEEANAIFRPRGQALPLNDALRGHAEATSAIKMKQSLPEAYLSQERALDEASTEKATKVKARADLAKKRSVLERNRKRVPLERRRARLAAELALAGRIADAAPRIEALAAGVTAFDRATRELAGAELDAVRAKDRVADAVRRCGLEGAAGLDVRAEGRIQRLVAERARLAEKVALATNEMARAEREIARLGEPATSAERDADPALGRALERARALGDAEARHAAMAQRLDRRRAELAKKAAALGFATRELDAVVDLAMPAPGTLDRLAARAAEAEAHVTRLEGKRADLASEMLAIERQLAEQEGDFAPPDAAALAAARTRRDDAFRAFAAKKGDADAFERALHEADAIADRMIREADRVTSLARLRSSRTTLQEQLARIGAERAEADAALAGVRDDVRAAMRGLGVDVELAELRALVERHARIADEHARLVTEEEEMRAARDLVDEAKRSLADALGVGEKGGGTLASLVDAATKSTDASRTRRLRDEEAVKSRARLVADVEERRARLAIDEDALAKARASLAELLVPLGLDAQASADEVQRTLEALRELESAEAERIDAERRREAAARETSAFAETVARAASDLAPDLEKASTAEAVAMLVARSRAAEERRREAASLDAQLADLGDVEPPTIEEQAVLADPDAAQAAVDALDADLSELDREISRLDQSIGGIKNALEGWGVDSGAAEASALAQAELARVRFHAERWCRARIAAEILRREIERYREENQGPLLGAASSLFARLTRGGFKGVRAGFDDDDEPALRCVRDDGAEVDVEGLSEGTRDQLYLALRLASLRRHAEVAGPMPVILDDVLIHFDEERSRAALVVLAELATTMQVVFFTHHERNVELAREAIPAAAFHVHGLGASGPGSSAILANP